VGYGEGLYEASLTRAIICRDAAFNPGPLGTSGVTTAPGLSFLDKK